MHEKSISIRQTTAPYDYSQRQHSAMARSSIGIHHSIGQQSRQDATFLREHLRCTQTSQGRTPRQRETAITTMSATAATTTPAPAAAPEQPQNDPSLIAQPLTLGKVQQMLEACVTANEDVIQQLVLQDHKLYACQQLPSTGASPLMVAAQHGHVKLCHWLLDQGAPWNAVDRHGQCAGNYATDAEHWEIVNMIVEWGTRSELILGALQRQSQQHISQPTPQGPTNQEPSTKPDYLSRHKLTYTEDGQALLDSDADAVMMEWERPIMKVHAQILTNEQPGKRVMNIGFGMGIIDAFLQEYAPSQHIIVEAHPDVYQKMLRDGWDKTPNVEVCFGTWQMVLPQLIAKNVTVDAIFFDTYGEHACDMEDFHMDCVPQLLAKPHGIYSFFNGLAPDNLFFQGIACNVVKLRLEKIGLETEYLNCQIQVPDSKVWEGVRRPYWHNRDTYYLPRITWNQEFLGRKSRAEDDGMEVDSNQTKRRKV